jgi:acetate kinase
MNILVANLGSTSFKFRLIRFDGAGGASVLAKGGYERVTDYGRAIDDCLGELKAAGQDFRAFEVLHLGRYERQAYLNITGNLSSKKKAEALARKEREFRDLILRLLALQKPDNSKNQPRSANPDQ